MYNISVDMNEYWMYHSKVLISSFFVRTFEPTYLIFFNVSFMAKIPS